MQQGLWRKQFGLLQFVGRSDFAAVGQFPFPGDVTIFAGVCWMIFFISVFYRGMEYTGSAAAISATFNTIFFAMALVIAFSILGLSSMIQQSTSNVLSVDVLASLLHWPRLSAIFCPDGRFGRLVKVVNAQISFSYFGGLCLLAYSDRSRSLNAINTLSASIMRARSVPLLVDGADFNVSPTVYGNR